MPHVCPHVGRAIRLLAATGAMALTALVPNCASVPTAHPSSTVDVRGRIRDPEGIGVESVRVFLGTDSVPWTSTGVSVLTDRRGDFRMRVTPGRYRAMLFALYARVPDALIGTVWLRAPAAKLDYTYDGLRIQGHLIGPGGQPVHRGRVAVLGHGRNGFNAYMAAEVDGGRYEVFGPPGEYLFVTMPSPGWLPSVHGNQMIDISADTTIDLPAGGNLVTGKVTLGPGKPLAGVRVEANGDPGGRETSAWDRTRHDGGYRLCLPPGSYSLTVRPDPSHAFISERFFPHTITAPQTIDLDMTGTAWRGTVRDSATGAALEAITVSATTPTGGHVLAADRTAADGRFMLILTPGWDYALSLSSREGQPGPRLLPANRAGNDTTLDLLVTPSH